MKKNISTIHIRNSADVSRKLGVSFDLAKTVVTNIGHVWHQGANFENEAA